MKAKKERWNQLGKKQRLQYIWDYYKFPIAVGLIFIYIAGYTIYGHFSKKDIVLYTALVNVSVSEETKTQLSGGFIDFGGMEPSKKGN